MHNNWGTMPRIWLYKWAEILDFGTTKIAAYNSKLTAKVLRNDIKKLDGSQCRTYDENRRKENLAGYPKKNERIILWAFDGYSFCYSVYSVISNVAFFEFRRVLSMLFNWN